MIGSTSAGNERMAVYLKGKKPCLNAVARAGNERMAVYLKGKKPCLNAVARALGVEAAPLWNGRWAVSEGPRAFLKLICGISLIRYESPWVIPELLNS